MGEGVLRLFGVLYAVGAVFLLRQLRTMHMLDRAIHQIEGMADDEAGASQPRRAPVDLARNYWLASGGVLLFAAGLTMTFGLRISVIALGIVALHQMAYFVRQRRRELAAATPEEAEDERPTTQTRNGFFSGLAMFVLAAWLERSGVLS
jgi:hypothetical protein